MKSKFIRIDDPCSEKWENMKPNENGSFCELCSKTVIDFTKLNQFEISKIMKKGKGNICARVKESQLNLPILDFDTSRKYNLPYSNIAAGLMIATTLTTAQPMQDNYEIKTEIVETTNSSLKTEKDNSEEPPSHNKPDDFKIIKGLVVSEIDKKPMQNAKITLITAHKIISTYTKKDGTFSLKAPTEILDNDNVIRVSYHKIKNRYKSGYYFKEEDYILSRKVLNTICIFKAKSEHLVAGAMSSSYGDENKMIIFYKDKMFTAKEFSKIREEIGDSLYYRTEYFESKIAVAIYGKKGKDGVLLITDKEL